MTETIRRALDSARDELYREASNYAKDPGREPFQIVRLENAAIKFAAVVMVTGPACLPIQKAVKR